MHSSIYLGILVLGIISSLSSTSLTKAQDEQVNYTEFLNCLSNAEVGGTATEDQVSDCFESVYSENGDGENGDGENMQGVGSDPSAAADRELVVENPPGEDDE